MSSQKEDTLRFALAVNRGMQLMDPQTERGKALKDMFGKLFTPTANHNANPDEVLYFIHKELFADWRSAEGAKGVVGAISESAKREEISQALNEFLWRSDNSLLDKNNFTASVSQPEELAQKIAAFYDKVIKAEAFGFGNRVTAELFLTALLEQPHVKEVLCADLDFRRLSQEEKTQLRDKNTSQEKRAEILAFALDRRRTPKMQNQRNGFEPWPDSKTYVSEIPVLSYQKEGKNYAVTAKGGLVPIELVKSAFEACRSENKLIADFTRFKPTEYLPGTESLRDQTNIDGIAISPEEGEPIFCLDQNILTGLRPTSQARLKALYQQVADATTQPFPFALANNADLYDRLMEEASKQDARLRRSVEVAYARVSAVVPQMDAARAKILAGKTPSEQPQFFMSMGGAGAGKSAVEEVAEAMCGEDNFVVASLDAFRAHSALYHVLRAANHHSDDYAAVQDLAGNLRDWVAEAAKKQKLHVLYDGTGIDYKGRYDKIVKAFKESGYHTTVCAVDTAMDNALTRIQQRFEKERRALPYAVSTGKHIAFPDSFMAAAEDKNADKLMLFANDRNYNQHHLVAETHILAAGAVNKLSAARARGGKAMIEAIEGVMKAPAAILSRLTEESRAPQLTEGNQAIFRYDYKPTLSKVLTVYESDRFSQFLHKGQMNPYAADPQNLFRATSRLKFNGGSGVYR